MSEQQAVYGQKRQVTERVNTMKMIIGGKKVDSVSGETFDVIEPATGQVIDSVPRGTKEDIDQAVTIAVEAQKEWNRVPIHERADILNKFLNIVDENKESLHSFCRRKTGNRSTKPAERSPTSGSDFRGS
jgi:succinate-semialdehyde dehydrogenase/glutarate-semialdehyde dehydrogenase